MNYFNRLQIVSGICLICLAGLSGCESGKKRNATVQGTVTIDGVLAKSGNVAFHPSGDVPAAYGTIHRDGTFALRIGRGNPRDPDHSKISSGSYVATVTIRGPSTPDEKLGEGTPPKPGVRLSAAMYSNKKTSGLAYTVKSGMNVINIEVESATEEELLEESTEQGADTPDREEQPAGKEESAPEVDESEVGSPPREVVENSTEVSSP